MIVHSFIAIGNEGHRRTHCCEMDPINHAQVYDAIRAVVWGIVGLLSALVGFVFTLLESSHPPPIEGNVKGEEFADAEGRISNKILIVEAPLVSPGVEPHHARPPTTPPIRRPIQPPMQPHHAGHARVPHNCRRWTWVSEHSRPEHNLIYLRQLQIGAVQTTQVLCNGFGSTPWNFPHLARSQVACQWF